MTEAHRPDFYEIDLEQLAKSIRLLGVRHVEHAHAETYNDALQLASDFVRSFIGREEYLPIKRTHRRSGSDGP